MYLGEICSTGWHQIFNLKRGCPWPYDKNGHIIFFTWALKLILWKHGWLLCNIPFLNIFLWIFDYFLLFWHVRTLKISSALFTIFLQCHKTHLLPGRYQYSFIEWKKEWIKEWLDGELPCFPGPLLLMLRLWAVGERKAINRVCLLLRKSTLWKMKCSLSLAFSQASHQETFASYVVIGPWGGTPAMRVPASCELKQMVFSHTSK